VGFRDDLATAKEHVADRVKTEVVPAVVNGTLYNVMFYRADSQVWAAATVKHPPRPDIDIDRRYGYNLSAVTREISESAGRVVEDGEEIELTAAEWSDFWEIVAPQTARLIEVNVWHVHEHDAEQEIARAKKASTPRPGSRKKST
jgi:hypothetical protein